MSKKKYEFNLGDKTADYFARMMMQFALAGKKETAHRHLDYLIEHLTKKGGEKEKGAGR